MQRFGFMDKDPVSPAGLALRPSMLVSGCVSLGGALTSLGLCFLICRLGMSTFAL